jgi:hypothetical protein
LPHEGNSGGLCFWITLVEEKGLAKKISGVTRIQVNVPGLPDPVIVMNKNT